MSSNAKEQVEARRAEWVDRLSAEAERMRGIIRRKRSVRKAVLFGSMGRGTARFHSDLDLAIVETTKKPFLDRLDEWYRRLDPRMPTDLLVYTPEEWKRLTSERAFVRRMDQEGKVLYEAPGT